MEHHHDTHVRLPLRLAAEPYAKQGISPTCVSLGILSASSSSSSLELAALADDDGVHAFCCSQSLSRQELLERVQHAVPSTDIATTGWKTSPLLVLVRTSSVNTTAAHPNEMEWHHYPDSTEMPTPLTSTAALQDVRKHMQAVHNAFVAELLTNAIRHYYSQQILEPSVRGFLSVLEKQFARADLYLFELLQNAVDDGATVVEFKHQPQALHVTHNGRSFTPLDVLGLSSVGLSTKSRHGKRTIGFMGVGFKAVYKRYQRVTIDDDTYRFVYQEPPNNQRGYGWVMLPLWQSQISPESTHSSQVTDNDRAGWCRFVLEQPRGGPQSIRRDLLVLPRTAPPLLGRAALVKRTQSAEEQKWILDWDGKRHTIERTNLVSHKPRHGSEQISVTVQTARSKTKVIQKWLFVTFQYQPSSTARKAYLQHTKRNHDGLEEICGFVPLLPDNKQQHTILQTLPKPNSRALVGLVHSVLPTKITLPIPMHFQGPWLLSVDRQQVQDLTDNEWNGEILQQFPNLIASVFRWAAAQKLDTAEHFQAIGQLLPQGLVRPSKGRAVSQTNDVTTVRILGQEVSLGELEQALWQERILPVGVPFSHTSSSSYDMELDTTARSALATDFYEGSKSIWVPPSWFDFLDPDFLRGWLGKRPLRTDWMGDAAYHPLFSSPRVIGQLSPLPLRTSQLASELGIVSSQALSEKTVWKVVQLLAAIGSAYREETQSTESSEKSGNDATDAPTNGSSKAAPAPSLPESIAAWPVFVTETCKLVTLDQILLPSADFANLPENLFGLLRPFYTKAEPNPTLVPNRKSKGDHRNKKSRGPSPKLLPKLQRIHEQLGNALRSVDRFQSQPSEIPDCFEADTGLWEQIAGSASSFLSLAREQASGKVVEVSTAISNLFESYSKQAELAETEIASILQISKYALDTGNPKLLPYVMIDTGDKVCLVLSTAAYIGAALDESGQGADLQRFAGSHLKYISARYNTILDSTPSLLSRRKLIDLFVRAGVQDSISISVSFESQHPHDRHFEARVASKLPGRKLPDRRKNAKADLYLPYGLGHMMSKNSFYILDCSLPSEWEKIAKSMSPESATGFVSLLLSIPFDNATFLNEKTVPAAAKCFRGQTESLPDNTTSPSHSTKLPKNTAAPLRQRLYFLPPGQPGGKALDIKEAKLVEQLSSIKWIPCKIPSHSQASLVLRRPVEALLEADPSRPDMPLAHLPPVLLQRLKSGPLAQVITWGTQAPPPPLKELRELALEAERLLALESKNVDQERVANIASDMFDVWNSIARSHIRDGLSSADNRILRSLYNLPCIPVKYVLDNGCKGNWIFPRSRCIKMPDSLPEVKGRKNKLKNLALAELVASNFVCDFNHSANNPFFRQPELLKAVAELMRIETLDDFPSTSLIGVCGTFIRYCCATEPVVSRTSSLRTAFSCSMYWCMENLEELPDRGKGLKVFVRHGPGHGNRALPSRWLPISGGPAVPVLDNNKTRSVLLTPEMKIQCLGVLNHHESDKDTPNASMLAAVETKILDAFGIMRLSDKRFVVKTRARGTPQVVAGASDRIQLVCALLKGMELDYREDSAIDTSKNNTFLQPSYSPPLMIRHESLTREFRAPGMDEASIFPLYAMFGRSPKLTQDRCILVSGDSDDYAMEMEELILEHVGVRSTSLSWTQTKPFKAAIRLLSHLENKKSFQKFVDRDFADFEAKTVWQTQMAKKEIIKKLEAAEKENNIAELRDLLGRAEELLEDEDDGGDSILESAREQLSKLEKEAEERASQTQSVRTDVNMATLEGNGRGRGVDNRPAWMSTTATTEATQDTLGVGAQTPDISSLGRGRGIDNRPAWMNESNDTPPRVAGLPVGFYDETPQKETLESPAPDPAESKTPIGGHGMGRGIDNRPAWMTGDSTEPTTAELAPVEPDNPPQAGPVPPLPPVPEEPLAHLGIELPPPVDFPIRPPAPMPTGRGRGVSNLPAWMTNGPTEESAALGTGDPPKRGRPESPSQFDDASPEPQPKKSKPTESLRAILEVDLKASDHSSFLTWLESTVTRETQSRGGSFQHISHQM